MRPSRLFIVAIVFMVLMPHVMGSPAAWTSAWIPFGVIFLGTILFAIMLHFVETRITRRERWPLWGSALLSGFACTVFVPVATELTKYLMQATPFPFEDRFGPEVYLLFVLMPSFLWVWIFAAGCIVANLVMWVYTKVRRMTAK